MEATVSRSALCSLHGTSPLSMFPPRSGCKGRGPCNHREYENRAAVSARGSSPLGEAARRCLAQQSFNGVDVGLVQCPPRSQTPQDGADLCSGRGCPGRPRARRGAPLFQPRPGPRPGAVGAGPGPAARHPPTTPPRAFRTAAAACRRPPPPGARARAEAAAARRPAGPAAPSRPAPERWGAPAGPTRRGPGRRLPRAAPGSWRGPVPAGPPAARPSPPTAAATQPGRELPLPAGAARGGPASAGRAAAGAGACAAAAARSVE